MKKKAIKRLHGFTLVELLVGLGILGIVLSMAILNLGTFGNELNNSKSEISSYIRSVRARAMASTSAYRIVYVSSSQLKAEQATNCSATTWTGDTTYNLSLRDQVTFTNDLTANTSLLCFNARGISNQGTTLLLRDKKGKTGEVEVFVGGALESR
jgi:prepilin-type N-terminal cleavage/methylation domain-containing protein